MGAISKKQMEREVKEELQRHMGDLLTWIDENYAHEFTPSKVEKHMSDAAWEVLEASWEAYHECIQELSNS